jgi:hypothetical protein
MKKVVAQMTEGPDDTANYDWANKWLMRLSPSSSMYSLLEMKMLGSF